MNGCEQAIRRAKALSTLAYTGLLFLLPPGGWRRYWDLVDHVSHEIIGPTVALWAELIDEVEEVVS